MSSEDFDLDAQVVSGEGGGDAETMTTPAIPVTIRFTISVCTVTISRACGDSPTSGSC